MLVDNFFLHFWTNPQNIISTQKISKDQFNFVIVSKKINDYSYVFALINMTKP